MAILVVLLLAAASPGRAPQWAALYSATYHVQVRPWETRTVVLPLPAALALTSRPLTMSWAILRPAPPPPVLVLEQCPQPDVCHPMVMRPTGQTSATTQTAFRMVNRTAAMVEVQFRYTVWGAR